MKSLRVQRRKAKNKSQTLTMGSSGDYYIDKEEIEKLAKIISSINSNKLPNLLESLLTKKELVNITRRIGIAKMLMNNRTYEEIQETMSASKTTVSLVRQSIYTNDGILGDVITKDKTVFTNNIDQDPVKKYAQNRIKKGK